MNHPFRILAASVAAFGLCVTMAEAQTVLKFSHTDNPGGSRQAAAEVFAKSQFRSGIRDRPCKQPVRLKRQA